MKLFLLRHAHARDSFPDEERRLSQRGLEQLEKLAGALSGEIFGGVAQIWLSPFRRARQSAEIFAQKMALAKPMSEHAEFTPCADPQKAAQMVAAVSGFGAHLLIVAHNPLLENLAALLAGENSAAFATATLGCLELEEPPSAENPFGKWSLRLLVNADMLS